MYPTAKKRKNSLDLTRPQNCTNACQHCKKSHLSCDNQRPCNRCTSRGKTDCQDAAHRKRGRPKGEIKIQPEKNVHT